MCKLLLICSVVKRKIMNGKKRKKILWIRYESSGHQFDALIFLLPSKEEFSFMLRLLIVKSVLFSFLWFSRAFSMTSSGFPLAMPFFPNQFMIESSTYSIESWLETVECESLVSTEFLMLIEWLFSFKESWHMSSWLIWSYNWTNCFSCLCRKSVSMWFCLNNEWCNLYKMQILNF